MSCCNSCSHDESSPLKPLMISAAIFAAGWLLALLDAPRYAVVGVFGAVYLLSGYRIILSAARTLFTRNAFNENLLMVLATAGAWALGEFAEAAAVMLFFHIGEYFQDLAVERSRRSITELMDIRPDSARVLRNEEFMECPPDEVAVGETVAVYPGERIPLDGVVTGGSSELDTSALTGESTPRYTTCGDEVLSGVVNLTGKLEIEVTRLNADSTVSRILAEVEEAAERKSKSENFITRFARVYTPAVFGLALLLAILPPLLAGADWNDWIYRALVFLVISCPCALVISVPLAFFAGIGGASRGGILFKGGTHLEALAKIKAVAFDKTGTLTQGHFEVAECLPSPGVSREELLAKAAGAEQFSNHPVAEALRNAAAPAGATEAEELAGRGVKALVDGKTVYAGNRRLMEEAHIPLPPAEEPGTVVHIAEETKYLGSIVVSDKLRPDAATALEKLRALGVGRFILLTGDNRHAADLVANQLGITEVHASLLPGGKVKCIEDAGNAVAFVGDGINDAPVLARADAGIAMGGFGSDAAVEAADVVLMSEELEKIPLAIRFARRTLRIAAENIVLALGVKAAVLALGAFGMVNMWGAIFADVGVSLLAVLNALRALRTP